MSNPRGKLLYHSKEESKKIVGDKSRDIVEKTVTHAEDKFYAKYYLRKNDSVTKIQIIAPSTGGEYTLIVKKNDSEAKKTTHNKKEILAFLKKNKDLDFMEKYVDKTKSLARAMSKKRKSKSKSKKSKKSKRKSKSKKSKSKKSKSKKSKSKKSKSKSKKSKSKSKKSKSKKSKSTKSKSKRRRRVGRPKKSKSKSKRKTKKSKSKSKSRKRKSKSKSKRRKSKSRK